jgi:ABC-type lipoprotein export system ATPase subunit
VLKRLAGIPAHQVQVSPKVGGMILDLHRDFLEGRFFREDEVLAELEDVDYRAEFEHAQAALAAAHHRYEELTRSWPKEIEQAQRELDEPRATPEQLRFEMLRNQPLITDAAVLQREYEHAKFGFDSMARPVERLEVALWLMKEGPRMEKVDAAKRDVEAAQADLKKADWCLGNCQICAPLPDTSSPRGPRRATSSTPWPSTSPLARWRTRHVGFVFQFYHLLPVLTAFETVEFALLLLPLSAAQRRLQVQTALELVGLTDRMRHRPGQLSGGQQQRVGIARTSVTDPTLLVADEPTGDLDARSAEDILDLLVDLKKGLHKTIIMVTHDPRAAARAERVLHLDKGRLVDDQPLAAAGEHITPKGGTEFTR